MVNSLTDLSRCCVHTITTKPWSFEEAIVNYLKKGVGGISVWQQAIEKMGTANASKILQQYPIEVVSYVRGGFFPSINSSDRQKAIDHNKNMLDEAAEIGAPLLVLVCGSEPHQSLSESRAQIQNGIEAILPHAESLGVKLGIEPLHPMYADTRSAINSLGQANDMAESINSEWVGNVIDVYHLWWDDQLENEIKRCGAKGNLLAYHVCDWKIHPKNMLTDRGLMGEGCIELKKIRSWVEATGFEGFIEVEIFSDHYWGMDQGVFLDQITDAYLKYV